MRLLSRMPVWVRVALAAASIALGVVIIARPTTALDVLAVLLGGGMVLTGVLELADRIDDRLGRGARAVAIGWIVLGVFVLLWPGLTVRAVAVITGLLLLVNGAAGLGTALGKDRTADQRIADAAFGVSGIVFGVLALGWPDITLLVVAVVFGAWLIMRGVVDLWGSVSAARRGRAQTLLSETSADAPASSAAPPRAIRPVWRWARTAVALVSVAVAVVVAGATAPLREGSTVVDEFYAAPRSIPHEPGRLIRSEPFTREVPDGAVGWRILYTTTGHDGEIRVASGLVVVPAAESDRPWPVIDWNHGTTGFDQHCAPSLQARPFWSGGLYPVRKVLAQGWAIVATDYIGLGTEGTHPYLFGRESAYASLDAVRAARQLTEAHLGPSTVIWGHSQGGGAALWAAALAREYAPEVWVRGVAAFSAASDPPALVNHVPEVTGGLIFASYAFAAFSETYPDITYERYIRPGLQPVMRAMAQRCLTDPSIVLSIVAVVGTSIDPNLFATDPDYGSLGTHLRENVAPTEIGPPLFLGQGGSDSIVPQKTQDAYAKRVCDAGQRIDYRRYPGYEHAQVMETYSPMIADAIAWTQARFDGDYSDLPDTCGQ